MSDDAPKPEAREAEPSADAQETAPLPIDAQETAPLPRDVQETAPLPREAQETAPLPARETEPAATKASEPGGARIGDYRILRELGRGGMGSVYEGHSDSLDRRVAIKTLRDELAQVPEMRERFDLEARAAARLRHPNIVGIHEVGEHRGLPYLVMEFVDGQSLAERIDAKGEPLSQREGARIVEQAARALYYAHSRGILHRDLKPANILLAAPDDTPLIADFGLARDMTRSDAERATQAGDVLGTPVYMPPEQARGQIDAVDRRADIYSLGVTLYEVLCGDLPFTGRTHMEVLDAVLRTEPLPPSQKRPGIDRDLEVVCLKCLEKDAEDRYASAKDLADDLLAWLEDRPITARPPSLPERLGKWRRRNRSTARLLGGVAAAVLALSVVGGAAFVHQVTTERDRARAAEQQEQRARKRAEAAEEKTRQAAQLALEAAQRADHRAGIAQGALRVLIDEVKTELVDVPGERARQARGRLLGHALDGLELLADSVGAEQTRGEMVSAQREVCQLAYYTGDLARAEAAGEKAVAEARLALKEQPGRDGILLLASTLYDMGDVHNVQGDYPAAKEVWGECQERFEEVLATNPRDEDALNGKAVVLGNLAIVYRLEGSLPKAREACEEALRVEAFAGHPENASTLIRLAEILLELGDTAGSVRRSAQAVAAARELKAKEEGSLHNARFLPRALGFHGRALEAKGDPQGSLAAFNEAYELLRAFIAATPSDGVARYDLTMLLRDRADLFVNLGQQELAIKDLLQGEQTGAALVAEDPRNAAGRTALAGIRFVLGALHQRAGRLEAAEATYVSIADDMRAFGEESPGNALAATNMASALRSVAGVRAQRKNIAGAIEASREALEALRPLAADPAGRVALEDYPQTVAHTVRLQAAVGAVDAALETAAAEAARLRGLLAGDPDHVPLRRTLAMFLAVTAGILRDAGRYEEAEELLGEVLALRQALMASGLRPYRAWRDLLAAHEGIVQVVRKRRAPGDLEKEIQACKEIVSCLRKLAGLRPGEDFAQGAKSYEGYIAKLERFKQKQDAKKAAEGAPAGD